MAWKIDPTTGAFYDDGDTPIRLQSNPAQPGGVNWLLIALLALIVVAAKRR